MTRFHNVPAAAPVAAPATLAAGLAGPPAGAGTAPPPHVPFRPPLRAGTRRFPHPWPRHSEPFPSSSWLPADSEPEDGGWKEFSLLELAAGPGSVPRARRHVRQVLSEWNLGLLGEAAELVVSELVTNAIRASRDAGGHRPVRLWLAADRARVAIGVWDGTPGPPVPAQPCDTDESGRGLLLVEAVSTAWDWYSEDGGKIVRALLDSSLSTAL